MILKLFLILIALYILFRTFSKQILSFITRAVFKKIQKEAEKRSQSNHFSHQNTYQTPDNKQTSTPQQKVKANKSDDVFGEYVDFEEV